MYSKPIPHLSIGGNPLSTRSILTRQLGSRLSNRFHRLCSIFLGGGLGSSIRIQPSGTSSSSISASSTMRTSSPYNLFIHSSLLKFSSISSAGIYFLGINLRVYARAVGCAGESSLDSVESCLRRAASESVGTNQLEA